MGKWLLTKTLEISSAHHLRNYEGPCKNPHGHNWKITVYCKGDKLDERGMLIDFGDIKKIIMKFDHKDLNTFPEFSDGHFNPTAENMAQLFCDLIPHCYRVDIEETGGNTASYER